VAGLVTFVRRWRLSDQKIRTKLTLILVFPLLAIVTLAGLNVASATSAATSAERARQLVVLGTRLADLAEQLQNERAAAALVFAAGTDAAPMDEYRQRIAASDTASQRFSEQRRRSSPPEASRSALSRIDSEITGFQQVRQQVLSGPEAMASVVALRYRGVIADLLRLGEALSQVDGATGVAARLRATAALGKAAEALGLTQTTVVRALATGQITPAVQNEIIASDADLVQAIDEFNSLAPSEWISRYHKVMAGPEVINAERLHGIVALVQPGAVPELGTDAKGWVSAVRARIRLLHALEADLTSELVAEIGRQRDDARRDIGLLAGGGGVAILCMIVLGVIVARSLTQSLTGLRATAEAMAKTRLPEMVARVSEGASDLDGTQRLVTQMAEPIPVLGQDEVGQVAAAFNAVTASAVRLAGEQAALRGGVRAIFNSLSRRSQRRLNTVMTSIDTLQAKETDPDQLAQLFQLDHAATGLRRLTAGLQVLAGGRAGLPRPQPVVLADVLRSAQSEIDQYQRIDLGAFDDDVRLRGETVEEVIHLLAELLDNAARFSAPDTLVVVDARRVGDRLHLQITDKGKGMTEAQLEAARERLASPHRLDVRAAQQMGLPVVAAIADRLGIAVELRPARPQGTRVDLTLPPDLFEVVASDAKNREHSTRPPATNPATAGKTPTPPDVETTLELPDLGSGWPLGLTRQSDADPIFQAESSDRPVIPPAPVAPLTPVDPEPAPAPTEPKHSEPKRSEPTPEVYQQLKRVWFGGNTTSGERGAAAEGPAPKSTELTESGLPKRRRSSARAGSTVAEDAGAGKAQTGEPAREQAPTEPGATESSPADQRLNRDSDQLRRRYAGLERGLMAARRRSTPSLPREEQQP
jgi:signal transduction histidine kinase